MTFEELREELDEKFDRIERRLVSICEREKAERYAEAVAKRVAEKLAEEEDSPPGEDEIRALAKVAIWRARRKRP